MQTQPISTITPDQYNTFEAMILSDQITQRDVPALLAANPDFGKWYRARAAARLESPRSSPTAEDRMNSALWGCLGLAGIAAVILGAGGYLIIRRLLS